MGHVFQASKQQGQATSGEQEVNDSGRQRNKRSSVTTATHLLYVTYRVS